jgi:hypothetical protein
MGEQVADMSNCIRSRIEGAAVVEVGDFRYVALELFDMPPMNRFQTRLPVIPSSEVVRDIVVDSDSGCCFTSFIHLPLPFKLPGGWCRFGSLSSSLPDYPIASPAKLNALSYGFYGRAKGKK